MAYGAPTNLDLSACIVSRDGGKTSQTLAVVATDVASLTTIVATAQSDATAAKMAATKASLDASDAKTAVASALTKSDINVAGGVAELAADGSLTVPAIDNGMPFLNFGRGDENTIIKGGSACIVYNGTGATALDYFNWNNPDGSSKFGRYLDGNVVTGRSSGSLNIGVAAQPINTVYAQNATVVASDSTTKTIKGRLTDSSYIDGQKLVAALATIKPTVYQLNSSIEEKGTESARYHIGYIAQDVEEAIKAVDLDPAKFALWTKTALFTVTQGEDKKLIHAPTIDSSPNQQYIQMLRYEEIFPVILAGVTSALTDLVSRVGNLETSAKHVEVA